MSASLIQLRNNLIEKEIINADFQFIKDYIFTSPSLAAAVVLGRNAMVELNGKQTIILL